MAWERLKNKYEPTSASILSENRKDVQTDRCLSKKMKTQMLGLQLLKNLE